MRDDIPPEAFLADFAGPIRDLAQDLREVVRATLPDVVERVRSGWRLIGYDAPLGRRSVYFAWVFPERAHVHLGFVHGVLIADPDGRLEGRGITKRARWLTWRPGDAVDRDQVAGLVREAIRVTALPGGERYALAMSLDRPAGG